MPGNNNISNVGRKERSFNKNILKSSSRETTVSDGTELREGRLSTRSRAGQWRQVPGKIKEDENQNTSIGLAVMKSFSINWSGKTQSAKTFLHTIFKIPRVIFLVEAF